LEQARVLLAAHKRNLREKVEFAGRHIEDFGAFLLIDGRGAIDDSIIGVVAGMLMSNRQKKPIIGLSFDKEGDVKTSGRAKRHHIEDGLNMGLVMKNACAKVGGVGGGHKQAAGGTLKNEAVGEFLIAAGDEMRRQMSATNP